MELAQAQERKTGATGADGAQVSTLRHKLRVVNAELDELRVLKKKEENRSKLAEKQRAELNVRDMWFIRLRSQLCRIDTDFLTLCSQALEDSVSKLKQNKVQLMRRQKEAAARHREYVEQKRREIEALRRSDRCLQNRVNRLQADGRAQKVRIGLLLSHGCTWKPL